MKTDIRKMHQTWNSLLTANRQPTALPAINFDEIVSSIFAAGPCYYYVIDFFDMSISHMSAGFSEAHGMSQQEIKTINDILGLIHPDDMDFVSRAEKRSYDFMYERLQPQRFTRYKASYNFRFRTADGSYRLFNHQALILTMDENNNFIKSLNIHTDISHFAQSNNGKFSLIGLAGEPSYLNMDVDEKEHARTPDENLFSKRELEVVRLIAKGYDSRRIAGELCISEETVRTHRKNILAKSGCRNASELIALSVSEGWI